MAEFAKRLVLGGMVSALLAGCQTGGGPGPQLANVGKVPLGSNLIGESCRLQLASPESGAMPLLEPTYDVFCGAWERPSGHVVRIAEVGDAPDRVHSYLRSSDWRDRLEDLAVCVDNGTASIAGGANAALLDCRLRDGGWPYTAFATGVAGGVYLADGIPAAQPALEAAVGVLAGTRTPERETAGKSAAVQKLEAALAGRLFGAGDLEDYQRLMAVGRYYNSVKSFAEAERRYREAVEIHERVLGADNPELGDPLMHLALQISNQERFSVAEPLFERAGTLVKDAFDPNLEARYVSYLSLHEANQRHYDEALRLAREATAMRRELAQASGETAGFQQVATLAQGAIGRSLADAAVLASPMDGSAVEIAQSQFIEASLLYRMGDHDQALRVINNAIALVETMGERSGWWLPQLLDLRGRIQTARGAYRAGESDLLRALELRRTLFPDERPVALTELGLADLYRRAGRDAEAIEAYRSALAISRRGGESVRLDQIEPYLDLLWAEAQRRPADRDDLWIEMFDAAQLVRGPVTEQNIADAAARLAVSDDDVGTIIRELQDARRERDTLLFNFSRASAQAFLPEDQAYLDRLRQDIEQQEARIRALEPQVQAAAPNLNILRDESSSFDQVRPLLRPGEALARFLVGDGGSYIFLATADGVDVARTKLTDRQLEVLVDHLRQAFVVRSGPSGLRIDGFDVQAAHLLYQQLLAPFEAGLAGVDHLIAVPSGPLLTLPLSVLVTAPPSAIRNEDYSGVDWLIEETAISVVPSARSFVDLRGKARPSGAPLPFIGFGDFNPVGSADIVLESRGLPEACRDGAAAVANAPRLNETAGQLRAMAASFGASPSSVILGDRFTEPTVRTLPLDQYRVLAFATHGLLPGELDCLSQPSLLTSYGGSDEPGDDGLLTYSEIFDLKLDAEVVVLSACNTGGPLGTRNAVDPVAVAPRTLVVDAGESDRQRGESLTGLARAFLYAGARSLLVSNWVVSTDATVALITDTFDTLATGGDITLAAALRQAQLDFANSAGASHPYLWASFTLIGDGARQF